MCRIALAGLLPMLLPLFAALVCAAAPGALRPPHPRRRARTSRGGRAKRDRANGTHGVGTYMGRQRASRFAHVCGGRFHAECRFEFIPLSLYVYIKNTSRVRIVRWYQAAAKRLRLILHRSMIYRRHPPRVRHRRLTGRTRVSGC